MHQIEETKPCDVPLPKSDDTDTKKTNTDYDVHDQSESDRREALKQLYSDYDVTSAVKQRPQAQEFRRQLSAGKTPTGAVADSSQPAEPPRPNQTAPTNNETGHPPSKL